MKQTKQARLHFSRADASDVLFSNESRPSRALREKSNCSVHANVELDQVGITAVSGPMPKAAMPRLP